MPKIGMEPLRRKALVDATLRAIGDHGSLSVTMQEIARSAGVSPALAFHYFGSKEQLLIASMRSLLRQLNVEAVAALKRAATPRERVSALIATSFDQAQFAPETVAAWLAFYVEAQRSTETRRLLKIYVRRLNSNLVHALSAFCDRPTALRVAEGAAAMIDGLYIRRALDGDTSSTRSATALVDDYIALHLA
jgi:TetR/AcrR family transcriptional regulator, transcriptional repressor of bet genes